MFWMPGAMLPNNEGQVPKRWIKIHDEMIDELQNYCSVFMGNI